MKKVMCLILAVGMVLMCSCVSYTSKSNNAVNYTIYCNKNYANTITDKIQETNQAESAKQNLKIEDGSLLEFSPTSETYTDNTVSQKISYKIDGEDFTLPYRSSYLKPFSESNVAGLNNISETDLYCEPNGSGPTLEVRRGTGELLKFINIDPQSATKEGPFTTADAEQAAPKLIKSLYGEDVLSKLKLYRTTELDEGLNNNILVQYARFIGDYKTEEMITVYYDRQGNVTGVLANLLGFVDAYGTTLTEEKVLAAENVLREYLPKELISKEKHQFFIDVDSSGKCYLCIYLLLDETCLERFSINIL